LNKEFDNNIDILATTHKRYGKKLFVIGIFKDLSKDYLTSIGVILFICYKILVNNSISLGDFAASVGAAWKLLWQINSLIDYLTRFKEHSLYTVKFKSFMNYKVEIYNKLDANKLSDKFTGLKFCNVFSNILIQKKL
jgi:ABC-type bacteriocin/lantibiotic exporter with double-glycine peptidase domain